MFDGRGGESGLSVADDRHTLRWLVRTDDAFMDRFSVAAEASGFLPGRMDPHPEYFLMTARTAKWSQPYKSPFLWVLEIGYSSEPFDQEDDKDFENPLDKPTVIDVEPVVVPRYTATDRDGNAILNAAGDPFLDPIETTATELIYRCKKNLDSLPDWWYDLADRLNESALTIYGKTLDAETVRFSPASTPAPKVQFDIPYFEVGWSLHWKRNGWKEKRVEAGYQYIDVAGDGTKKKILVAGEDGEGTEEPKDPQLLKADGDLLPQPISGPDAAIIKEIDVDETGDFSVIPLDTD
jgi:hypothetical protein